MSWQSYVDNLLAKKTVAKAAIYGHDGSMWAASPGFQVAPPEHNALFGSLKGESGSIATLQAGGVKMSGQKYMFLRADPILDAVFGRKGDSGCIAARTVQAVVYATYENGIQPGDFTKDVCAIQDYLKSTGF